MSIIQSQRTIRWGIIGCGDVTEVKSGPAFQKARNSALVAVMRRDAAKAADYARRHGVPRWYDDAARLIADPDVDAVYVATPPDMHEHYAVQVAAAGKPVYVEKPMARSYDECQRMIAACQKAAVPLFVAYYRRCLPRFMKVKELVEARAIGDVRFVTATLYRPADPGEQRREALPWRVQPEIAGGGLFLDLASHTLDVLDYILGPVARATGYARNQAGWYSAEDVVAASLEFQSGALGTGMWCFSTQQKVDVNEIVGSHGRIRFSTFGTEPVQRETSSGIEEFALANPPHIQQPLIQTIVDDLNGTDVCPSTGQTAARTSRVMDLILQDWRLISHAPTCSRDQSQPR